MGQFLQYWGRRGDFGRPERNGLFSIETMSVAWCSWERVFRLERPILDGIGPFKILGHADTLSRLTPCWGPTRTMVIPTSGRRAMG